MPNPLAIGVTLGGLLLDVLVPRPKPRAGSVSTAPPADRADRPGLRTPQNVAAHEEHDTPPAAGVRPS